jgi:galactonate dehydratase
VKITSVEPLLVDRCLLVRVYTDEGVVGLGEAGLWAYHKLVHEAIGQLAEYYVGKDASAIEHHYQVVTRDTHFSGAVLSAALSAIDVALWDIKGKAAGLPVYQLLGGKCRDKVRVFASSVGETLDARAASAMEAVDRGYTSIRTLPFFSGWEKQTSAKYISDAVAITRAIREAIGPDIDLGIDLHRNFGPDETVTLCQALAPYNLQYVEDPTAPESLDALRYVARHVNIPLAIGERSHTLFQFKELLATGTASMIRPDLSLAGGFTQVKKIAALAEADFVGIFPHLMGSPVNLAAYVQLNAAIPNYALMESGSEGMDDLIDRPLERDGGWVIVPDRPGIGVELREEKLSAFPYRSHSIRGAYRADGSVAH